MRQLQYKRQNMGSKLGTENVYEAGTEDCRWSKSQVQKVPNGCSWYTISGEQYTRTGALLIAQAQFPDFLLGNSANY